MDKIYFVTGNKNKLSEVAQIMPGIEQIDIDLPEIQSLDPREVIEAKLQAAHRLHPDKAIAVEDISYEVAGLNGLPGTLVKWFLDRLGADGLYDLVDGRDTTTKVVAHIGMIRPSGEIIYVSGEVSGKTVGSKGREGFAFDRIFIPDGLDLRYSEIPIDEKNRISHRSKAWNNLKDSLNNTVI